MKIRTNTYSLGATMEMAKRGMNLARLRMSVTGNNVNNVNTEGYSRQDVVTDASTVFQDSNSSYEMGLIEGTIRRVRDSFHYQQLVQENPSLGRWEEESHQLELIERILNEPNENSISHTMDNFFNSWETLSQDLENQASRTIVRDSGNILAKMFNTTAIKIEEQRLSLNKQIHDDVTKVNLLLEEISGLNKQILKQNSNSSEFSTLLDRRDKAVNDLSKYMDIKVTEKDNGAILIHSSGIVIANERSKNRLNEIEDSNGNIQLSWESESNKLDIKNGKLFGLLNTRDNTIPEVVNNLNSLVKSIVENVNRIHSESYNLEGNSGYNFFSSDGTTIDTIALDENVAQSTEFISVSRNQGSHGNGDGALLISALANEKHMGNRTQSFKEFYLESIVSLSNRVQEAERMKDVEKDFVTFLENKTNEVSQVDLDEELSNMIKYQQAYGAATKVLSKTDEMMVSLLSIV
ncbi:MAG: flagellar hook-associated protein FlgK [Candidatus Cloacimonadota bacterium]|nr:MAG: flagellar hook-associated protein FlgK [Candidatus Cloacimonadota bacterium]PIE77944.1 MAG: flagellar hook-associated protein FlgK [Candidatus Delongbacteria bacterium]